MKLRICSFPLDGTVRDARRFAHDLLHLPHEPVSMEENQTGVLHLQKHKQ